MRLGTGTLRMSRVMLIRAENRYLIKIPCFGRIEGKFNSPMRNAESQSIECIGLRCTPSSVMGSREQKVNTLEY